MAGDNPRADQFFRTLKNTGGKAVSSPGVASGRGPSRYVADGPTSAFYAAQHKLMDAMDAERLAPGNFQPDQYFTSVEAMQAWVDEVTALDWSHLRAGPPLRVVVVLQDARAFTYVSGKILAPRDRPLAWRSLHLTHELSHAHGNPMGHDLTFVRTMITMMDVCISPYATQLFRHYLTEMGVQI